MLRKIFTYDRTRTIIAVLLAMTTACVFFGMTFDFRGMYWSDSPDHIEAAIRLEGYGLETILFYFISRFADYPLLQLLFALWETAVFMATWFFCQKFIEDFFHINRWMNLLVATGLMFLCSIYIPVFCPTFYMHSLGTQPWHSSTQLAMRLGAVIFLYFFLDVYPEYRDGISKEKWLRMSILLAVTTMMKPNFLISFCAAFGIIMLRDLLKYRTAKVFKQILQFGSIIALSLAVLGVQYWLIYATESLGSSSGIQLVFFSDLLWEGGALHMLFKFGRDLAFPFLVWSQVNYLEKNAVSTGKKTKSINFLFLMYLASLLIFSLFKETGHRANHGNFEWGVLISYFTMFLYMVPAFIENVQTRQESALTRRRHGVMIKTVDVAGCSLLILHFASGLLYYLWIAMGRIYWR